MCLVGSVTLRKWKNPPNSSEGLQIVSLICLNVKILHELQSALTMLPEKQKSKWHDFNFEKGNNTRTTCHTSTRFHYAPNTLRSRSTYQTVNLYTNKKSFVRRCPLTVFWQELSYVLPVIAVTVPLLRNFNYFAVGRRNRKRVCHERTGSSAQAECEKQAIPCKEIPEKDK